MRPSPTAEAVLAALQSQTVVDRKALSSLSKRDGALMSGGDAGAEEI
jgi:hypothetical protein